jgi:putative tricarboxylic transport membrane protein
MLAAVYYGAMYGGSTTSILMNIPGEISSVITCVDGYQMTKQGRAASALAIAAISSFIAGTIALVGLSFFAPLVVNLALKMGPPEILGLVFFAFTMVVSMAGRSLLRGLASAAVGMFVSLIGLDSYVGATRFTFGSTVLTGGVDFVAVIMGLFAMTEVFKDVVAETKLISNVHLPPWHKMIKLSEIKQCFWSMVRSSFLGFFVGCVPGVTGGMVGFLSYEVERRVSKNRNNFGKGAIEGVAAPEGANNAWCSGSLVPLLTLGLPTHTAMAVLLSGLMIYGLQPGPLLFETNPLFVWAVIASMYIGNVMLLILNLPLVGIWTRIVNVPYRFIAPMILLFCFVGTYSVRNSFFDVATCLVFGILGLLMGKLKIPTIPLVISIILTDIFERSLRQTISMGGGSLEVLLNRPIAIAFILAGIIATSAVLYLRSHLRSGEVFFEGR